MADTPKLEYISFQNYMGCKSVISGLAANKKNHIAIVGKNNSGKTTIVSSLKLIKKALSQSEFKTGGGGGTEQISYGACDAATIEIFSEGTDFCILDWGFWLGKEDYSINKLFENLPIPNYQHPCLFSFEVRFEQKRKILKTIRVDGQTVFNSDSSTSAINKIDAFMFSDKSADNQYLNELISIPKKILDGIMYIPSTRRISSEDQNGLEDELASGASIIPWIRQANNPDSTNLMQKDQHKILNNFCRDFAKFVGVPEIQLKVSNSNQLQVSINNLFVPISNLGTGISECLIILLATRVAKFRNPYFHTLVLEEPELHLHPDMQRQLIDLLIKDGINLIVTTHSSVIISEMLKNEATLIQTIHGKIEESVEIKTIKTDKEIMDCLDDIGATAADLLQADMAIWLEGPTDVPVFREWLKKIPNYKDKRIAVVPLGGGAVGNPNFDFSQLKALNPKILVVLDSEKESIDGKATSDKTRGLKNLTQHKIPTLLTLRRCTENYFSSSAIKKVYVGHSCPDKIDHYLKLSDQVLNFSKNKGHLVAKEMVWDELKDTDIGKALYAFINGESLDLLTTKE